MKSIQYYIVDVFAEQKYQGNQLAVFTETTHLKDHELRAIAAEIGFAECAFIDEIDLAQNRFKIRIFTPETEVPFAGHPCLGSAFIIQDKIIKKKIDALDLSVKAGVIPISFENNSIYMEQIQPTFSGEYNRVTLSDLLGVDKNSISDKLPILEVSTGLPYIIIPFNKIDEIDKINIQRENFFRFLLENKRYKDNSNTGLSTSLFIYTDSALHSSNQMHGRMFSYENHQVVEDAATGSANGCLLAYLLKNDYNQTNVIKYQLEQGFEMNRPSLIYAKGKLYDDGKYRLSIGGKVNSVAEGKWYL